jgi:hypothetical protein
MEKNAPRAACGAHRRGFDRRVALSVALLVAVIAGLFVSFAPDANAATPLPAPITDYANYPAGIVPSLIPAGCNAQGGAIVTGALYSSGGQSTQFLESLQLQAGDTVRMTWTGFAAGCAGARISLAVKASQHPVFDPTDNQKLVAFDSCGGDGPSCSNGENGFGPLTITVPDVQTACNFQIDAVIGAPLAEVGPNGSYYSQDSRGLYGKPSGPNMLIRANNGGIGDCTVPPEASAQLRCTLINGTPGVHVTVNNPDDDDTAVVDILKNGALVVDNLSIAPNGSESRDIPFANGQTATVTVHDTVGGTDVFSQSFTANCLNPAATATKSCASGGVNVHLSNLGAQQAATFVVTVGGTSTPHTVAAGGTEDFTIPVAENGTVHVTVTSGGATLIDSDFTLDCFNPAASATKSCAEGGVLVHLSNTGGELPVTFTVTVDGTSTQHIVAANGSEDFTVPAAENQTVHVTITSGESTFVDNSYTFDCVNPAASALRSCSSGGIEVHLSNTGGELPVDFVVTVDGVPTTHTVAADGSEDFTVPVAENGTVHLTITSGQTSFVDDDFTLDCVHPTASAAKNCIEGGVEIHLANTGGELPATFIVTVGDTSTTHTVPADGTEDFTVPVAENDTVHVAITVGDSSVQQPAFNANAVQAAAETDAPLVDSDFTMDCFQPGATMQNVCGEDGGAQLTLTNTGEQPAELTVTKNGVVIDTVTVAPNGTEVRTYPMNEDETATFQVTGAGYDSGAQTVTHDCAQVQAVTETPTTAASSEALARTGASGTRLLLTIAGLLLMVGGLFLAVANRRALRPAEVRNSKSRGR